jgi:hypothetical protein
VAATSAESSAPPPDRKLHAEELHLNLRDPVVAGVLAWLIPGAGHWYQGRRTKAILFFLCIYATFFYGLWLGGGRVVYASWGPTSDEKRLPYLCQIGTGAVALPALWQAQRYSNGKFAELMHEKADPKNDKRSFSEWFMAPPLPALEHVPGEREARDEIDIINYRLNRRFELGTVYTMVAGLLNLLVIFDALGGPAYGAASARSKPAGPPGAAEPAKPPAS